MTEPKLPASLYVGLDVIHKIIATEISAAAEKGNHGIHEDTTEAIVSALFGEITALLRFLEDNSAINAIEVKPLDREALAKIGKNIADELDEGYAKLEKKAAQGGIENLESLVEQTQKGQVTQEEFNDIIGRVFADDVQVVKTKPTTHSESDAVIH